MPRIGRFPSEIASAVTRSPQAANGPRWRIRVSASSPRKTGPYFWARVERSDSGTTQTRSSLDPERVTAARMDPHLSGELGLLRVEDDEVALPLARDLSPAARALRLVGDRAAVPAGLEIDHALF